MEVDGQKVGARSELKAISIEMDRKTTQDNTFTDLKELHRENVQYGTADGLSEEVKHFHEESPKRTPDDSAKAGDFVTTEDQLANARRPWGSKVNELEEIQGSTICSMKEITGDINISNSSEGRGGGSSNVTENNASVNDVLGINAGSNLEVVNNLTKKTESKIIGLKDIVEDSKISRNCNKTGYTQGDWNEDDLEERLQRKLDIDDTTSYEDREDIWGDETAEEVEDLSAEEFKDVLEPPLENRPSIAQFFAGRSVFITGATGFMGKVLVEKLLRSCPQVGTIYLLLRPKRGHDANSRFRQLASCPLFANVRARLEAAAVPLAGDVLQPGLGLSDADADLLVRDVAVVFHLAATVRFDEPLRHAVLLNTRGTRELAQLAARMTRLQALVHVSTAFSNCDHFKVDEQVYPCSSDPANLIHQVEQLSTSQLQELQSRLLKDLPNTYVFSKALAEHVIHDLKGTLPAAIFRPSVVCPSYKEPMPGWVDSNNGPMGVLIGASTGILRSVHGDGNMRADLLPVDMAINAMLAVAWDTAVARRQDIPVYNCTTGSEVSITWNQFLEIGRDVYMKYPSTRILWYPGGSMHRSVLMHLLCFLLTQILPALLIDGVLLATRQKPWLVKLQKKIFMQLLAVEYFLMHEWTFTNSNLRSLLGRLSPEDRQKFDFDASNMDIRDYIRGWVLGSRRFVLHLDDSSIPKAKTRMQRLFWLHCSLKLLLYAGLFWMITTLLKHILFTFSYSCWPVSC